MYLQTVDFFMGWLATGLAGKDQNSHAANC